MADISHIIGSIDRYVASGIPTGGCTEAILSNDLFDAFGKADEGTRESMFEIVSYIYNNCPIGCHGSREAYSAWLKHRGLAGLNQDKQKDSLQ